MFDALAGLLLDAADITATVTVLVAVWEGRISYGSDQLRAWFGLEATKRDCDVDDFLREVRQRSWPRYAEHRLWSLGKDDTSLSDKT